MKQEAQLEVHVHPPISRAPAGCEIGGEHVLDIEKAIEQLGLFLQPQEEEDLLTLEHFDIQDGKLRTQKLSKLERTIAFTKDCVLGPFSQIIRNKKQEKYKAIRGTLQESLDLLKVYSSALHYLQKGSEGERRLAEQVLSAAKKYNAVVRQVKTHVPTISSRIKHFFFRMAGWTLDQDLIQDEIHIPAHKITIERQSCDKIVSVLQSVQRNTDTTSCSPSKAEIDLFRTKALTLLLSQTSIPFSLTEALFSIHETPIRFTLHEGAYLMQANVGALSLTISPIPGVEIEITGAFEHDSYHPELTIPLKESFQLRAHIVQTGFPHPLQYTGIGLHEKLLPNCLLRPQMCPKLEKLLEVKHLLAQELLPDGSLYHKAKRHLLLRKALFQKNDRLFARHMQLAYAHFSAAGIQDSGIVDGFFQSIKVCPDWYVKLSHAAFRVLSRVLAEPTTRLQEEWLLKASHKLSYVQCQRVMLDSLEDAKKEIKALYSAEIIDAFGKAAISLHLLQLSEHLLFEPKELTQFEKKLLTSLFRQQLIFAHELLEMDEHDLERHITSIIEEEISLFEGRESQDEHTLKAQELVEELIQYYWVRFETR